MPDIGAKIIESIICDLKQNSTLDKDIDFEKILKEYNYLFTQKWLHKPTKKIQEWLK